MGEDQKQRREFNRINDMLRVEYRRRDRSDVDRIKKVQSLKRMQESRRYRHADLPKKELRNGLGGGDLGETVIGLFAELNRKLDQVISILDLDKDAGTGTGIEREMNVSGSGIGLLIDEPFVVGEILELKISLPVFKLSAVMAIETIGEVVWVREQKDEAVEGKSRYCAGIKFISMNEDDREEIVGYTFSKKSTIPGDCGDKT